LRAAWLTATADVVAYMDVDLSTDLRALPALIAPLLAGEADAANGSRLRRDAVVRRGAKREHLSRGYNLLLRLVFQTRFSNAQCRFKALRRDVAHVLLPHVDDENWFFDTVLLLLAEEAGVRLHEVPVVWVEDRDSRVRIAATVREDLAGIWRVRAARLCAASVPPAGGARSRAGIDRVGIGR
jgi:glycosyltransferase involved in cell wall biosynthesis